MHWWADLRAYALAQMPNFVPPADRGQLRVVHTLYLVGLMSALDIAKELFGEQPVEDDWRRALDGLGGFEGKHNSAYVREIRNAAMHRGLDLSAMGMVVNGQVCVVAPRIARERRPDRPVYQRFRLLLRNLYADCEDALAHVVVDRMVAIETELSDQDPADYVAETDAIREAEDWIPKWVGLQAIPPELLGSVLKVNPEEVRRKFETGAPAWLRVTEQQSD
jgi:hypothetical protein